MFLNDNQYFYVYLYWGKSQMGHICPMLPNQYAKIFSLFFFHFKCILLQISHTKCYFINIFYSGIPGLISAISGYKATSKVLKKNSSITYDTYIHAHHIESENNL